MNKQSLIFFSAKVYFSLVHPQSNIPRFHSVISCSELCSSSDVLNVFTKSTRTKWAPQSKEIRTTAKDLGLCRRSDITFWRPVTFFGLASAEKRIITRRSHRYLHFRRSGNETIIKLKGLREEHSGQVGQLRRILTGGGRKKTVFSKGNLGLFFTNNVASTFFYFVSILSQKRTQTYLLEKN